MKYITVLLITLIVPNLSFCQKNVIWESETKFEYFLERQDVFNFETQDTKNGMACGKAYCQMVKFDITKSSLDATRFFTKTIIELLRIRKLYAYSLNYNHRLSVKDINEILIYDDLMMTNFDPETFKDLIVKPKMDLTNRIHSFIIKQQWKFNINTNKLESKVLGIIPVMESYRYSYVDGKSYKEQELTELFWIPFNNRENRDDFDINNPDNIWIKMSIDRVSFDDAEVLKGNSKRFLKNELWDKPINNAVPIYDVENELFFKERLPNDYLKNTFLKTTRDTTLVFDSKTNTEILQINTKLPLQFSDIVGYKIYQYWYYNPKSMTINSKLIAIEPLIPIHKEVFGKNHCYYKTLFHRTFMN